MMRFRALDWLVRNAGTCAFAVLPDYGLGMSGLHSWLLSGHTLAKLPSHSVYALTCAATFLKCIIKSGPERLGGHVRSQDSQTDSACLRACRLD